MKKNKQLELPMLYHRQRREMWEKLGLLTALSLGLLLALLYWL